MDHNYFRCLPTDIMCIIYNCLPSTDDRNSFSLTCKFFYDWDRKLRDRMQLHSGVHPINEALKRLIFRFYALERIEISYIGWTSSNGAQIDDLGLYFLMTSVVYLKEIHLQYCGFISDSGIAHMCHRKGLKIVKMKFIPGVSGRGILSLVSGCQLEALHLEKCMNVRSSEWIEYLGVNRNQLEDCIAGTNGGGIQPMRKLTVIDCRGIGRGDFSKLGRSWEAMEEFTYVEDKYPREILLWPSGAYHGLTNVTFKNLKVLKLAHCSLLNKQSLNVVLLRSKNLVELEINNCSLQLDDLCCLAENCQQLRVLRLTLPNISNELLELIGANLQRLEILELSGLNSQQVICSGGNVDEALQCLKKCVVLKEISVGFSESLTWHGLHELSQFPSLTKLELKFCKGLNVPQQKLPSWGAFPSLEQLAFLGCTNVTTQLVAEMLSDQVKKLLALTVEGSNGVAIPEIFSLAVHVSSDINA